MTNATVTLRDGVTIDYRLIHGQGPARFALVHSLAMDRTFWEPVAQALAAKGDVLLWSCRGHGASGKAGAPYSGDQFADDLNELMDAVGWTDAVVAGASMGGCVALAFAGRHAGRVRALGLVDTTAWYGEKAPEQWDERARKAEEGGLDVLVGFQKSRWFSAPFAHAHPQIVQDAVDVFLANDLAAYAATCRMIGGFDARGVLPGIAVPTRILVGSDDYATPPAMAEAMRDAIPGARMDLLDGAAHLTPLERVDAIAAMLLDLAEQSA